CSAGAFSPASCPCSTSDVDVAKQPTVANPRPFLCFCTVYAAEAILTLLCGNSRLVTQRKGGASALPTAPPLNGALAPEASTRRKRQIQFRTQPVLPSRSV